MPILVLEGSIPIQNFLSPTTAFQANLYLNAPGHARESPAPAILYFNSCRFQFASALCSCYLDFELTASRRGAGPPPAKTRLDIRLSQSWQKTTLSSNLPCRFLSDISLWRPSLGMALIRFAFLFFPPSLSLSLAASRPRNFDGVEAMVR